MSACRSSGTIDRIAIVVPARNEERLISRCLDSVAASVALTRARLGDQAPTILTVVVVDGSDDDTERIARSFAEVQVVAITACSVGAARRAGVAAALGALAALGGERGAEDSVASGRTRVGVQGDPGDSSGAVTTRAGDGAGARASGDSSDGGSGGGGNPETAGSHAPLPRTWIANTDADSVVPPGWLLEQLALADSGTDVMLGTVSPDPRDLTDEQVDAWRRAHPPGPPRGDVYGANLGVRANLYQRAGGFANLSEHEDVDLVARLTALDARLTASAAADVLTSGRQAGRTPGGFAGYLRTELLPPAA